LKAFHKTGIEIIQPWPLAQDDVKATLDPKAQVLMGMPLPNQLRAFQLQAQPSLRLLKSDSPREPLLIEAQALLRKHKPAQDFFVVERSTNDGRRGFAL